MEGPMFLPQAQRRGELHFHLSKSLPYRSRIAIAFALIATGLTLQVFVMNTGTIWSKELLGDWRLHIGIGMALLGLGMVLVGVVMLLVKGYSSRPSPELSSERWRTCRREEVERIVQIDRNQRDWDVDSLDITNPAGIVALVGAFLLFGCLIEGLGYIASGMDYYVSSNYKYYLIPCVIVMLVPFWLSGTRSILKKGELVLKAGILLRLHKQFQTMEKQGERFQFQMLTRRGDESGLDTPADLKAGVTFQGASPEFLGVQMQITINEVQGSRHPYCYCIIVAKKGFPSDRFKMKGVPPSNVVVESSSERDTDVFVIRQRTTEDSGYHTGSTVIERILRYSLEEARKIVA